MTPVIYRDTSEKQPYNLLDGVVYERRHLLVADYASAAQCVRVKANTWMPRFGIGRGLLAEFARGVANPGGPE